VRMDEEGQRWLLWTRLKKASGLLHLSCLWTMLSLLGFFGTNEDDKVHETTREGKSSHLRFNDLYLLYVDCMFYRISVFLCKQSF
jgi:hypothetical protein